MIIPDAPARSDGDGAHPAETVKSSAATGFDGGVDSGFDSGFDSNRIRASFVLLLGALTAIGPFTIDMYLAAFPADHRRHGTQPAAVQLTITATLAGLEG